VRVYPRPLPSCPLPFLCVPASSALSPLTSSQPSSSPGGVPPPTLPFKVLECALCLVVLLVCCYPQNPRDEGDGEEEEEEEEEAVLQLWGSVFWLADSRCNHCSLFRIRGQWGSRYCPSCVSDRIFTWCFNGVF